MIIPGSVIPKWFRHQSIGAEVNIEVPSHLCDDWMGTTVCVVFSSLPKFSPACQFIANGKEMATNIFIPGESVSLSDHIWLFYLLSQEVTFGRSIENHCGNVMQMDFV